MDLSLSYALIPPSRNATETPIQVLIEITLHLCIYKRKITTTTNASTERHRRRNREKMIYRQWFFGISNVAAVHSSRKFPALIMWSSSAQHGYISIRYTKYIHSMRTKSTHKSLTLGGSWMCWNENGDVVAVLTLAFQSQLNVAYDIIISI